MRRLILAALLLTGCDEMSEQIILTGTVLDGPGSTEGLAQATVTVLDHSGRTHATATSDDRGIFEVWAPPGDAVYVDIEAPDHVRASFVGVTGLDAIQEVEPGTLFGFSQAELDAWEARYEGCPTLGGATVLGEVRVHNLRDPDTGGNPSVGTANVVVEDESGLTHEACYLDAEEGLAWDPEAVQTGPSGTFLIGSVPPGSNHTLVVRFEVVEGQWLEERYPLRVTEGGVAPRFPAWVDWPL